MSTPGRPKGEYRSAQHKGTPVSDLRALLLTDVVDSTKLTEALGDAAMAVLWAAHDRAARDLLPVWRGREIDKTDGMLLLFDTAADALGYALAYHRALAGLKLPFLARAGLHVGPVSLRANPADDVARGAKPVEVDGLALPVAARVMSVALGGQTLLSADARIALGVTSRRVLSHGHWRLSGVADPVELFEVGEASAPFEAPPDAGKAYRVARQGELWVPLREVKHSLPAERDSFVGRQEPLRQLATKLEDGARLVSVLGMGGTGKTRLVTRFAWSWLGEFPGGVWFCDLSQARTLDGIFFAVAQGLDVPLGKTDPAVQLAHAINGRGKCLVILDNFEQVARHAEETLGRWLDRAVLAKFIVTTREVLGIVGEETFALAPLPPSDAAMLFLRRAEAARRNYRPSAEDRVAIEQLVSVLDHLPLAIELAAARVRVMPPATLLTLMSERFKLLRSAGGRNDRQATLRAAFDWSWELLSEPEKAALAQLSVFEGGFTLETAEAVLDLAAIADAPWTVDAVQLLVDKSFVRQVADDRFDLLESVREYAAEHLQTEGRYGGSGARAAAAAQARHWQFFAGLDEMAAVANGCAEANNLVVACRRAAAQSEAASAIGAMRGAWSALRLRGPFRIGADLAARVFGMPDLRESHQAEVNWVAGCALDLLGEISDARAHFETGLAQASAAGDRHCEVRLLVAIAAQRSVAGHLHEALADLTRALGAARELEDRSLQCMVLNGLGRLADHQAHLAEARGFYEEALGLARGLNDRRLEGGLLGNLGGLHFDDGKLDEAREHYEMALALAREVGDRRWEGNARCNLGLLHHEQGHSAQARAQFETALSMARDVGYVRLECTVLCNLGLVLEAQGEMRDAGTHYGEAVTVAHELGDGRLEGQFRGYLGLLHARAGRFAESRACLVVGEALLRDSSNALSLALLTCGLAEAEHLAGDAEAAQGWWRRAQLLAEQMRVGENSELGRAVARLRALFEHASAN
jgi:predicted ATPase/class 3 adenylate cyclase/Tfp pilus assembly protein PilF